MIDELHTQLRRRLPAQRLLDVHTHIGQNDPDGFSLSAGGLHAALAEVDATAVVFPMREPDGYAPANDEVLEAARLSEWRLHAFCRVDPRHDPVVEMRRCLDRGARGVKLHPASDGFDVDHPGVEAVISLCDERRLRCSSTPAPMSRRSAITCWNCASATRRHASSSRTRR